MATKKTTKADPAKERLEKACYAMMEFLKVANFLFGANPPYEMKDIGTDSPYYKVSKELADEMGVDWNNMTHQDSNRIMLALLDEYYNAVRENEDERVRVEVRAISLEKKDGVNTKDSQG